MCYTKINHFLADNRFFDYFWDQGHPEHSSSSGQSRFASSSIIFDDFSLLD